jgi:hypothetical protein
VKTEEMYVRACALQLQDGNVALLVLWGSKAIGF